jgi:hypothetical protein
MSRYPAALVVFAALLTPAFAQTTLGPTPGPGGIPLAPGAPVTTYSPGGIGPGGTEVAPGVGARGVPMTRTGPGGGTLPLRPDDYGAGAGGRGSGASARLGRAGAELPQSLTLTINSRDAGEPKTPPADTPVDSISTLFDALRGCWAPPSDAHKGVQMSVRFSFKRTGELMGPPRVTYTTPGTEQVVRDVYRNAITASLGRCAPMPFSKKFGAAIAGNPLSIRYVDDRGG